MKAKNLRNENQQKPVALTQALTKRLEREARALGVSVDALIDWALLALADELEAKSARGNAR